MNIKSAKTIVLEALSQWAGFKLVMDDKDLFTAAGMVKLGKWSQKDLFKFFDTIYTIQK